MKQIRWWLPALVFLACLAAYLPTLNPAFRADDSPETIAVAVTLGIQHPPGYPLHSLIGRLFSLLPVGAPAFRLNFMAAFFGALTCALLTAALLRLLRRLETELWAAVAIAATAGLGLGLSKTFWSQSLAAKGGIYTLHSACMAGLFLLLLLWHDQEGPSIPLIRRLRRPTLGLAYLLFMLSFGNHWETQALLAPATLAFLALALKGEATWTARRAELSVQKWRLRDFWVPSALACVGLSIYAYLPLRASQSPFLNWGDPRSWDQFWWVFQRQEYLDLEVGFLKSLRSALFGAGDWSVVAENWAYVQRQGLRVLGHLFSPRADLGFTAVLLSLGGAWSLWLTVRGEGPWKSARTLLLPVAAWCLTLLAAFAFVVTFYFHLKPEMIWILDVFLIPAYMVQALLVGLGLAWAWRTFMPAEEKKRFALLLPLALAPALYAARSPDLSQARHFIAYDYGMDLLLSAKPKAVILAEGDFNTMPVYYLQQVAGKRLDVDHITTVFLSTDWGVEHARRVQPRLGLGSVPKAVTGARAGDGQVLRAAISHIAQSAAGQGRPIQASLFRQVQAENVREWEPGFRPNGLLAELNGAVGRADDRRREGLLRALRTRHLEFDRAKLDPSPEFALSNYGTAYLEMANYLRMQGDVKSALPLYRRAALVGSRSNLAEILTHHGIAVASGGGPGQPPPDPLAAVGLFKEALAVKPLFEAYANLAGVCNQLGQSTKQATYYQEAEGMAREALGLSPNSAPAWNNLAIAQYYQGRRSDALATLRQALQLAPQDPQILGNIQAIQAAP